MTNNSFVSDSGILKALVLCAGKGTRLRPLTDSIAKPLIPVANRPILFYIFDQIKDAGIKEIGLVVSPDNQIQLENAVGDGTNFGLEVKYIIQSEPKGLAHAVRASQDFLGNSSFLLFLGDNLIQGSLENIITRFNISGCDSLIMLKEVSDPRMFGVAELNSTGEVVRLVEKPKEPKSNLAMVGVYLFTSVIHRAIGKIKPSWRNELEITDAIQWLIENDKVVLSDTVCGWWLDTGKKEDLLAANRVVLDEFTERKMRGDIDSNSLVEGRVDLSDNVVLINSTIHGPAAVGKDCLIKNSKIGPFTSIGDGTSINGSIIENSIMLSGCRISNINLKDSAIGMNVEITRRSDDKTTVNLFVGSYSKVEL